MGRRCDEFERFIRQKVIALSRNPDQTFARAKNPIPCPTHQNLPESWKTAWVCGGRKIYEEAIPLADRLYLTLIDAPFEGDVFFPLGNFLPRTIQ